MYEFSLLTEFDEELHDRTLREEGRAENREEMLKKLSELVASGEIGVERLSAIIGLSEEEIVRLNEALASNPGTL